MNTSLVIGATKGLGREVLAKFLARGDRVIAAGRSAESAPADGTGQRQARNLDLTDAAAVDAFITRLIEEGTRLNYLVFSQRYRGQDDPWSGELEVSVRATRQFIDRATELFATEGDRAMVAVSSVFGDFIGEGQPASYHVGKAALNQLMRHAAVNLGRRGIRSNIVTPFTFLKEESRDFYIANEKLMQLYKDIVPLGGMGSAEDSAKMIAFLCSAEAAYVTGQNIYVDGGLSLVWPETLARKLQSL